MRKIAVLALFLFAAYPLALRAQPGARPEEPFPYTAVALGGITALALGIGGLRWAARNRCPRCRAKKLSRRTLTLSVAGYKSEGRHQTTETCASCGYQKTFVHRTPPRKMTDTSSFSKW